MAQQLPLSAMRKKQLVDELTEAQAEGWSEEMTVVELRAVLKNVRKVTGTELNPMKGMNSKRVHELKAKYRELTGLEVDTDATKGEIMIMIRKHFEEKRKAAAAAATQKDKKSEGSSSGQKEDTEKAKPSTSPDVAAKAKAKAKAAPEKVNDKTTVPEEPGWEQEF